jgi:hypothetical protein
MLTGLLLGKNGKNKTLIIFVVISTTLLLGGILILAK